MRRSLIALVLCFAPILCWVNQAAAQTSDRGASVRVVTVDFVLPGKLDRLERLARAAGLGMDRSYVEALQGPASSVAEGTGLVVVDTPRPNDVAKVAGVLGNALTESRTPWIRIGGGPPAFGNLPPHHARRLIGYYAAGGPNNLAAFFAYAAALQRNDDPSVIPEPVPLPAIGIYHPASPAPFSSAQAYREWGRARWPENAASIAVVIHRGLIASMETRVVDALIASLEKRGLVPLVFWTDAVGPSALTDVIASAQPEALIVATHLQNGPARAAEFTALNIPVIQTVSYREGGIAEWRRSRSGMNPRVVAPFLAVPEGWGTSDPMTIDAVENGEPAPIPEQVEALSAKVASLSALRRTAAGERRLALMVWNYPPGEKNLSASHLNVPRSLEHLATSLAAAGYDVTARSEAQLISDLQAMLGGIYAPSRLSALLDQGLADTLPVSRYLAWLDTLPAERRQELLEKWGDPSAHSGVIEIAGEKRFVIPRIMLGRLAVMPQLPRGGEPGAGYHDTSQPPSHWYLAAYLYVRERLGAHALLHFGTHGTQEWTPGKDRGLSVHDYPYLTVGALPVFYPYIQDNISEALQAKRRGRAVVISHQTPAFAPAGLYDELRDLHAKLHEISQLDEGAVRQRVVADVRRLAGASGMARDMGWSEEAIDKDTSGFFSALHDHLHELARAAMPLGLHTFGRPSIPEHRLSTVMQQLGRPFYEATGGAPDEAMAGDYRALQQSAPYRLLHRHLRDGEPASAIPDDKLRALVERAGSLDRHLAETGEIEALLQGLSGGFVAPGSGGDPIRNPDVPSGRNLFAFEPDKIPTPAAFEAGAVALQQLLEAHRQANNGPPPRKLAFSLWSGETIRHLGLVESQAMHALGLRPVWNEAGRVVAIDIVPRAELGRPRIDVVLQVTSVYRDQFDGFMRLLAGAIEKLAVLDEPDNPVAANARRTEERLLASGQPAPTAKELAALRIFSNAPGDYGTGLPNDTLRSTAWQNDQPLADAFLARLQYGYGARGWGVTAGAINVFSENLRGVEGAVLSRSSRLHGVLSTDHPFEYLGGLALAVRRLDGRSPALYISDVRHPESKVVTAARFLADELRVRALNPQWITEMQREGYAGTVEVLNHVNNLWGWQVAEPGTVRADQWQAVHDTFVRDTRTLGLAAWFERHNPTAQGQIIERMIEAIRKGYWDAPADVRRELAQRWQELADEHGVRVGEEPTLAFVAQLASAGFGTQASTDAQPSGGSAPAAAPASRAPAERVVGQEMRPVSSQVPPSKWPWSSLLGLGLLLAAAALGAGQQFRTHANTPADRKVA